MDNIFWYKKFVTEKENRVIVKLHHDDGEFWKSIIIPTAMYPLNGNYKVFTYQNTEEVKDERILEIFDRHQYKVGQCYSNTLILSNELLKKGYSVKTYVG